MRRWSMFVVVVLLGAVSVTGFTAAASDDLPRTFGDCVLQGGDIRPVDGQLTCRLIRAYDFRVYGAGVTECGETIELEIWGETREGVVTYLLDPAGAIGLPQAGEESMALPEGPWPCRED